MSASVNAHVPQISVERSEKDSTCRACSRPIFAGKTRVKIAYTQVVVRYTERTGSPSFFMHLECFRDHPVDYVKDGANPWKNWHSIKHFAYRTSQVEGLGQHPDAKLFFSNPVAVPATSAASHTVKQDLGTTISTISGTSSKRAREQLPHSAASSNLAQGDRVEGQGASESGSLAKRPHVLVQFNIPSWSDILEECQGDRVEADKQFRLHLDLEAKREATYNRAQRALIAADKMSPGGQRPESKSATQSVGGSTLMTDSQPARAKRIQEHAAEENKSDSESDSDSDPAAVNEENEIQSTLQWMKPGQLTLQVGVSISVLRRWANLGVVRTLVSEGGHRLFNVASVVDYIEQQATESSTGGRSHDDAKGSDVVLFVRLPDRVGADHDKAALSDAHNTSARMRDAAKHVHQQLRSVFPSSKLIIELPEGPLEDFQHRNSLNRLHAYFTKQQVRRLILCSTQDISKNSVAYKLFEWMCAKHDVTIEIVSNLYTLP